MSLTSRSPADALKQILAECVCQANGLDAIAAAFFPRAAEVVSTPWALAANFHFPARTYRERTGFVHELRMDGIDL